MHHFSPILEGGRGGATAASPPTFLPEALLAMKEINEGDKTKAVFKDWKTDIQSVTLKECRAHSKKRLASKDARKGEIPSTTTHSEHDTNYPGNRKLEH